MVYGIRKFSGTSLEPTTSRAGSPYALITMCNHATSVGEVTLSRLLVKAPALGLCTTQSRQIAVHVLSDPQNLAC